MRPYRAGTGRHRNALLKMLHIFQTIQRADLGRRSLV